MSQQLVYRSRRGIVLASDGRVVYGEPQDQVFLKARAKIFPLGRRVCIAASGLGVGLRFCLELQRQVEMSRLEDFAPIRALAESHISRRYAQFITRHHAWYSSHPEAPKVLCFILAGCSSAGQQLVVWEGKDSRLPLGEVSVGAVFTVPRVLGLEAKLVRLRAKDPPLAEVALFCLEALQRLAEREETVGRPFQVAILNERGCWMLRQS